MKKKRLFVPLASARKHLPAPPFHLNHHTLRITAELLLYSQEFMLMFGWVFATVWLRQQASAYVRQCLCAFNVTCPWPWGSVAEAEPVKFKKVSEWTSILCSVFNRYHLPLQEKTQLKGGWTLLCSIRGLAALIWSLCTHACCTRRASKSTKSA